MLVIGNYKLVISIDYLSNVPIDVNIILIINIIFILPLSSPLFSFLINNTACVKNCDMKILESSDTNTLE